MDNNKKELLAKVASLETTVDMLETELSYLDGLLLECGFPEGIKTLKQTALELIKEDIDQKSKGLS